MERRRPLVIALAGLLVLARPGTSLEPRGGLAGDPLELGRRFTAWFFDGRVTTLWQQFAPGLREVFGTPDGLMTFRRKVREDAGREIEVLNEQLIPWMGSTIYGRTARFSDASHPIRVVWTIDSSGLAEGLTVRPATAPAASNHLDYRTRTSLQLPQDRSDHPLHARACQHGVPQRGQDTGADEHDAGGITAACR